MKMQKIWTTKPAAFLPPKEEIYHFYRCPLPQTVVTPKQQQQYTFLN